MASKDDSFVFGAIRELVDDLWELFGDAKKNTPLALYHRLIQKIEETDVNEIKSCVSGFATFFENNSCYLSNFESLKKVPRDTYINYGTSKTVYLDIQKYLYKADDDNREIIRQHLLTISAIMKPSEAALSELDATAPILRQMGLGEDSKEGEFIATIMQKAKNAIENVDARDPTAAIMGLVSSGVLTDVVQHLQTGVSDGTMDIQKLLGSMQGVLTNMIPQTPSLTNAASTESAEELPDV